MTPLRFYWICPLTVSRDNKNQRKSQSVLTHTYPERLTSSVMPEDTQYLSGISREIFVTLTGLLTTSQLHGKTK